MLELIVESPAPSLPQPQFSPEFCDFVALCLCKKSEERVNSRDLLGHPFVVKHQDSDISEWARSVRPQR
eukprot:JP443279.1.p1 GENE.JP443279.1~~JP443279.1.p1  ORF type:complete len:76 (+),score=9.71 JP443279.1:22-228(+)